MSKKLIIVVLLLTVVVFTLNAKLAQGRVTQWVAPQPDPSGAVPIGNVEVGVPGKKITIEAWNVGSTNPNPNIVQSVYTDSNGFYTFTYPGSLLPPNLRRMTITYGWGTFSMPLPLPFPPNEIVHAAPQGGSLSLPVTQNFVFGGQFNIPPVFQ